MRDKTSCAAVLSIVAGLAIQGCAAAPAEQPPVARAPAEIASEARQGPAHVEADAEFLRHMIHHHAQALEMTALVEGRAASELIPLMAERIEVSQRDEIARMQQWLRARGYEAPVPAAAGAGAHAEMHGRHHAAGEHTIMPGMLTREELRRLAAADGPEFDRLFLEYMIRHHEGALVMVEELFAAPGAGQEPEIYQIASEIAADQEMEIARMRRLLQQMTG